MRRNLTCWTFFSKNEKKKRASCCRGSLRNITDRDGRKALWNSLVAARLVRRMKTKGWDEIDLKGESV